MLWLMYAFSLFNYFNNVPRQLECCFIKVSVAMEPVLDNILKHLIHVQHVKRGVTYDYYLMIWYKFCSKWRLVNSFLIICAF